MTDYLTRRQFMASASSSALALAMGSRVSAASVFRDSTIAWAPRTLCGLNMGYGEFWGRDIVPGQFEALSRYGVSFVRGMYFCYHRNGGKVNQDAAVQKITSVAPFAADPTQLSLVCESLTYVPPAGDKLILSDPITYRSANGAELVLPARTPLRITSAEKGMLVPIPGHSWKSCRGGEIRVRPMGLDGSIVGKSQQPSTEVFLLHANFYTESKTFRHPISDYVKRVPQWLDQGFAFDHGGEHNNWDDLFTLFGQSNVQPMREQEWEFFAGLDWNPASVLICDENEPVWPSNKIAPKTGKPLPQERWALYKPYFQDVLYPRMRHYFPKHTLGFGTPDWCNVDTSFHMDWWPKDKNTLLRLHYYPGGGDDGVWKINADKRSELDSLMTRVADVRKWLEIPHIYFQEFGVLWKRPNGNAVLKNIRQAIQAHDWPCAVWAASYNAPQSAGPDTIIAANLSPDGLWQPLQDALGAFGNN